MLSYLRPISTLPIDPSNDLCNCPQSRRENEFLAIDHRAVALVGSTKISSSKGQADPVYT